MKGIATANRLQVWQLLKGLRRLLLCLIVGAYRHYCDLASLSRYFLLIPALRVAIGFVIRRRLCPTEAAIARGREV